MLTQTMLTALFGLMRVRMDKKTESATAVEPNIDKLIAHWFKRRGMSWPEQGAQSLLKIRQTIANGEWETGGIRNAAGK